MKRAVIILFLLALSVYSVPEINYVSPYINSRFSVSSGSYYNPLIIEYNYRQPATGGRYVAFANDIYFKQRFFMSPFSLTIGTKDEKNEVRLSCGFVPLQLNFRHKYNAFELGNDRLFRNVSLSPFYGFSMAHYVRSPSFDRPRPNQQRNNGYIQTHFGTALGTRKNFARFSYFEIFASPNISLTYYGALGGGPVYNPIHEITPSMRSTPRFSVSIWDFSMPIGVGIKYRNFFFRNGLAVTHTFGGEERKIGNGILTVDSYNFPQFPVFIEFGTHIRMFRRLERREREAMNE